MASLINKGTDLLGITDYGGANDALANQLAALAGVPLPELTPIKLDQLVSEGVITPEQAQAFTLERSRMEDVYVDPRLKSAQMDALSALQEVGVNGMSDVDRAKLAKIQSEEDTALRGQREALAQSAAMRGVGGSGLDLMNQQLATQQSAQRQSARDTEVAGQAQQARMAALQQAGALAGSMGSQDWQQQAARAQAADAINQFNLQNRQRVQEANIGSRNQAQAANLAEAQRIKDQNVAFANQQKQYNASLPQQQFQNMIAKAGGIASAYGNQANMAMQQSKEGVNNLKAMGSAAYMMSDMRVKENIKPADIDIDEFLNDITGYKYNYKDPSMGEGKQIGVMAQDMEKSPLGAESVIDAPEGKAIDMKKALSTALAGLARVNERINNLEGK